MSDLLPGTAVDLQHLSQQQALARQTLTPQIGAGLSGQSGPGGLIIQQSITPEQIANAVPMTYLGNVTGKPILACSLVHLLETADHFLACDVADYSGRRLLGIALEDAAVGAMPLVQYQGIGSVIWDLSTLPAAWNGVAVAALWGRRLGARGKSPFAQWDRNGPLLIVNQPMDDGPPWMSIGGTTPPLGDLPTNAGASCRLITVRLDVPFGDTVYCTPVNNVIVAGVIETPPSAFGAAARCIVLGSGFHVAEPTPGDITI